MENTSRTATSEQPEETGTNAAARAADSSGDPLTAPLDAPPRDTQAPSPNSNPTTGATAASAPARGPKPAEPLNPDDPASVLAWVRWALGTPADAPLLEHAATIADELGNMRADRAAFRDFDAQLKRLQPGPGADLLEHVVAMCLLGLPLLARIAVALEQAHERAFVFCDEVGRPRQVVQGPARTVEALQAFSNGKRHPPSPLERIADAAPRLLAILEPALVRLADAPLGPHEPEPPREPPIPAGHVPNVLVSFPSITKREIFGLLASGAHPHDPPTVVAAPGDDPDAIVENVIMRWAHAAPTFLDSLSDQLGGVVLEPEGEVSHGA